MFYIKLVDSVGNYEMFEVESYRIDYEYPEESDHVSLTGLLQRPPRLTMNFTSSDYTRTNVWPGDMAYIMNNEGKTIDKIGTQERLVPVGKAFSNS